VEEIKKERTLGVYKFYLREDIIEVLKGDKTFQDIDHLTDVRGRGTSFCKIPYRLLDYVDDDKKSINAVLIIGYIMSTSNETFNLTNFFNSKLGKGLNKISSTIKVRKEIANFGAPVLKEFIKFGKIGKRSLIAKVNAKLYEEIYSGIDQFVEYEELHDETTEELSLYIRPKSNAEKTRKERASDAMALHGITEEDFKVINLFTQDESSIILSQEFLESLEELNCFSIKGGYAIPKNENIWSFIRTLLTVKKEQNIDSFNSSFELLKILEKKY